MKRELLWLIGLGLMLGGCSGSPVPPTARVMVQECAEGPGWSQARP